MTDSDTRPRAVLSQVDLEELQALVGSELTKHDAVYGLSGGTRDLARFMVALTAVLGEAEALLLADSVVVLEGIRESIYLFPGLEVA